MANDSPAAIIYSSDGYEATVKNGVAIVAGTPAIIMAGSDGTNSRYATLDSSGRLTISGAGTAGSATGGVVTIQGIAGGTTVPVSGTVTATNASVSITGAAVPGSATYVGISDGTNLVAPLGTTGTPAGTEFAIITRNIPSGTQTVAGSGNFNILGTGTAGTAASGVVTIQGIAGMTAVSVSGTVTANIGTTNGLALDATLAKLTISQGTALGSNTQAMVGGSVTTAAPTYTTGTINPFSLTTAGALRVDNSANTQPVSGTVSITKSTTGTSSNVASSASNVTLLASNANRLGATIYNDSSKKLYIKLGATASLTSFTALLFGQGYFEVPFNYTGIIDGIWESANGSARVTELT